MTNQVQKTPGIIIITKVRNQSETGDRHADPNFKKPKKII